MSLTIAEKLAKKALTDELTAFETAVESAAAISEHETHRSYRFDDGSVVNIFISEDYEFTILAA